MKYVCQVCGYVYDEDAEKVPFKELPEDWKCPVCKAPASAFAAQQPQPAAPAGPELPLYDADGELKKLSAGQFAALCSNLSRACEKLYRQEEAGLFAKLAESFAASVPDTAEPDTEAIAEMLRTDISYYPAVRAEADKAGDRGAARALVWGEKVTRMLSSLIEQYQREGESMLEGRDVWVCTACGFVYVGESAPELCPVCKVPSWKFEKIEGREKQ